MMSTRWMVHLKDGRTLTDKEVEVHEVEPELITSVERNVGGRTITIRKSPLIDSFYVMTEEGIDADAGTGAVVGPKYVYWQAIGCVIKDSDPITQCNLRMDPNNHNAFTEFFYVKQKRIDGLSARVTLPPKIRKTEQKNLGGVLYGIINEPPVEYIFSTPTGIGCRLNHPKIRAEMAVRGGDVILGIMHHNEILSLEE